MSNIIERHMLVCTDAKDNHNKYWEGTLYDTGEVRARWGRVGGGEQSGSWMGGASYLHQKMHEKARKGYKEVAISGQPVSQGAVSVDSVKQVARDQIQHNDPVVARLIDRLATENRHQIVTFSGGKMDVDVSTGIVTTPVGLVTHNSIVQGRSLLDQMLPYVTANSLDNPRFIDSLENYLMCVPQKVGSRRGWHREFLASSDDVMRQAAFLDQLDASIEMAENLKKQKIMSEMGEIPKVFDVRLSRVEDPAHWKLIQNQYFNTRNDLHAARRLKPKAAYEVHISSMADAFEKDGAKVGNIQSLWHGTRTHNLLSILKVGLIIPKSGGGISITGRMFGDGLYFSDQSTKALNYAYGYWSGAGRDSNCFMFLADVAMGKSYTPSGSTRSLPAKGYDSTFAKAGKSGVMNNEMIVYRASQANLKVLVEFGE